MKHTKSIASLSLALQGHTFPKISIFLPKSVRFIDIPCPIPDTGLFQYANTDYLQK